METLEITKKAAIDAHKEAKNNTKKVLETLFGKKVFQKDITERVQSVEDAIEELGENDEEVITLRQLQKAGITNHVLYEQQAVVFTKALNEGWVADWHNGLWDKWYNYFNMSSSSAGRFSVRGSVNLRSLSACGFRLCFKSKALAQYAGRKFIHIYEKFVII